MCKYLNKYFIGDWVKLADEDNIVVEIIDIMTNREGEYLYECSNGDVYLESEVYV